MKKLKIFLLILLVFSVFIPKTHADVISQGNFLIDANLYNASLEHQSEVLNATAVTVPNYQFPVFFGFQINNLNFSKSCESEFGYRVDYSLFGWHNYQQNLNWVNYAKLISVNNPDIETIGTIITKVNNYTLNFSTFFIWRPSYCPVDTINSLNFRIADYARFPLNQNYFYSVNDYWNGGYYYVFDSLYQQVNITSAQNLVNDYYETGSITQEKLDNISGQLVHVNTKLEETNEKLNNIYQNITNSDVTTSQNTANGFFNNFNTEDNGGLSAIVTAPLRAINSMVDGTCQPLTATWRGKTISLPCGTEFWDKMSPIRIFLNVIEGGIICYGILIDIYKMINRMKNPEDDRVDVMKL